MSTPPTSPAPNSSSIAVLVRRLSDVSLVRFGIVGVSNTAIGFTSFWILHRPLGAGTATGIGYVFGTLWSYHWNRRWTFQSQGKVASEATRFFALQGTFMALSWLLMHLLVERQHLPAFACWLSVSVFVTVLNFVASRYWAFKAAH
ncbi:MAG TPA: GtrA family protein [Polyangiaceae bacterium]|nr:GtrA family protein [Polyangiaceae bacterium]